MICALVPLIPKDDTHVECQRSFESESDTPAAVNGSSARASPVNLYGDSSPAFAMSTKLALVPPQKT